MATFNDLTAEQKEVFRLEFEDEETTRERRVELLTMLQEGANEAGLGVPCPMCRNYPFFAPYDEALIEGHVYSDAGLAEIEITRYCEFCFDKITAEPEEEEDSE